MIADGYAAIPGDEYPPIDQACVILRSAKMVCALFLRPFFGANVAGTT